jgi:SAM-dependent methyltransferase
MSHQEQRRFVALVSEHLLKDARPKRILEIGSYDVNGSVRELFNDSTSYLGADLIEGPGVDLVKSGHEIDLESNSLDLTLSCECFEHNPYWLETLQNMIRMTKPGGWVVFTCASQYRLEHGTARSGALMSPGSQSGGGNYYRNLRQSDFEKRLNLADIFVIYRFYSIPTFRDLYFFGVKKGGQQREYDLSLFERQVSLIRLMAKQRNRRLGLIERALRNAYDMPIVVAPFILDDQRFQDFALAYIRVRSLAMRKLRRLAMRLRGWRRGKVDDAVTPGPEMCK